MQTVQFIRDFAQYNPGGLIGGFKALTDQFGISVKFVDDLAVLNYNQIESPKTHPIVIECRSLILNKYTLKVVSRSFDRFFNLGEALNVTPVIDWSKAEVYEKVDGSLIKIYHHNGKWQVATRGTAYAESDCMGYGITFRELVFKALGVDNEEDFQELMLRAHLDYNTTYIFELTSVENRVVRHYSGYNLHFLASRYNDFTYAYPGYTSEEERLWLQHPDCILSGKIKFAKRFNFTSEADAVDSAAQLKDLDEGYIVYQDGAPVCKIKSPAYVAVHHLRNTTESPKELMRLAVVGEGDEIKTYFPEYGEMIDKYKEVWESVINTAENIYKSTESISDQKEFAIAIRNAGSLKSLLFTARRDNKSIRSIANSLDCQRKVNYVKEYS